MSEADRTGIPPSSWGKPTDAATPLPGSAADPDGRVYTLSLLARQTEAIERAAAALEKIAGDVETLRMQHAVRR